VPPDGRPFGRWLHLNGRLVDREKASVPALDRGVQFGYGLYETMRSYGGRVFRLEAHYGRLHEGARLLDIALPLSLEQMTDAVVAVLKRNKVEDARLRLTVTAGPEGGSPAVMLVASPLSDYPPELYERGMSAVTASVRRNETSPLCHVKSLSVLDNFLAREDARRRGADEAILLNTRGQVAEGSWTNVFLVRGGRVVTPGVESGILPGVTRAAVLELAAEAGLTAVEAEVGPEDVAGSAEAFLTNSVMEVMPLTSIDGRKIGAGRPGPATERLRALYREVALRETAERR
jgi:branched-chain amino acid aminotransferase group I